MHISAEEKKIIDDILRFYLPGQEVWAFGSRVTGKRVKKFSDLDLAIINNERMPVRDWARVKDAFELSPLRFRVDVLDWATVSPEFRKVIEEQYEVVQSGESKEGIKDNHAR